MRVFLANLWNNETGVSSVEYALLLSIVGSGIILATDQLSAAVVNKMGDAAVCIEGVDATTCV